MIEKTVTIIVKPRVDLLSIDIRTMATGEVEVAVVADLPNEVSFTCWVTPSFTDHLQVLKLCHPSSIYFEEFRSRYHIPLLSHFNGYFWIQSYL